MCPVFHNVIVIAVLGKNFKILRARTASEFCKIFQEPKTSHYKKKKKKSSVALFVFRRAKPETWLQAVF